MGPGFPVPAGLFSKGPLAHPGAGAGAPGGSGLHGAAATGRAPASARVPSSLHGLSAPEHGGGEYRQPGAPDARNGQRPHRGARLVALPPGTAAGRGFYRSGLAPRAAFHTCPARAHGPPHGGQARLRARPASRAVPHAGGTREPHPHAHGTGIPAAASGNRPGAAVAHRRDPAGTAGRGIRGAQHPALPGQRLPERAATALGALPAVLGMGLRRLRSSLRDPA